MRKKYPFLLILGILVPLLAAHQGGVDSLEAVFGKINREVLQNGQGYETLRRATSVIGHRLTGSPNGRKAEEFTYDQFRQYGFRNVKYQPFDVESWMRDTVSLEIVPKSSDNFHAYRAVALAHSPVRAEVKGQLVDVGNGLAVDYDRVKDQLRGKVALVNIGLVAADPGLKNLHRSEKTALAIAGGATGVVFVNQVKNNVVLTGTASVTGQLISIPAVCIGMEDGEKVRQWMKEEKRLEAHIDMRNKSQQIRARNVIATMRGSSLPNERIIIGGHLDSWDLASGAIDNGIGSFTVLEIARVFQSLNLKPKRTIQFVMFMGEEQGLLGSEALVQQMVKDKSIRHVRYMINLDMAGNPIGFNVAGRDEMLPFFRETGGLINRMDTVFRNTITNRASLHSDHQSFMLEGIPVASPVSNLNPAVYQCYHADCDHFRLVDKRHMDNSVRFTAMLLYALANADQLPARRLNSDQTRDFLVRNQLKDELILGQKWRWGK
jgi:Iap family predicted aminopeptidase